MGAQGLRGDSAQRSDRPKQHPVHVVHRVGAALLGLGLWVFAGLGFAQGLAFFSTQGQVVLGLSNNGLLSAISAVAGAVLLVAAAWRGPVASTATAVMGGLFLLSGLVHFAVLGTPLNILAFRLPNVFFSLIAGMLLMFLGLYGRLAGGLPEDNPYRQARAHRHGVAQQHRESSEDETTQAAYVEAELAMAEGHPTPQQQARVEQEQRQQQEAERERLRARVREREQAGEQQAPTQRTPEQQERGKQRDSGEQSSSGERASEQR